MSASAETDLEEQLRRLAHADKATRLSAIRQITHVYQRPDLATVEALLEVALQLERLADDYEIAHVSAVDAKPKKFGRNL